MMATKNVHQDFFISDEVVSVLANVTSARALLRTLIFAVQAVEDGSILFEDEPGVGRWSILLAQVRKRLVAVRSVLTESISAPTVDWYTPLNLAEALDAALWHLCARHDHLTLESADVISAAQAVIDSLDELLADIQSASLPEAS